ncbi:MAG TPA: carbamoyltransferase HypF [Candidatus Hydrogenedentes bacterium]|nr:carbamoyltransferase HypF [Candidatus Hydrogenedentota bacterium]
MSTRIHITVSGAVQGVGFRPFVYGLATRAGLAGFVLNEPRGVTIELEGPREAIGVFLAELESSPPPLARIERIETRETAPLGESGFRIRESAAYGERSVLVPPDLATCSDCLREMADPSDRRYRYPFINCTNCGPRYTIIQDLPYDRAKTTMADFVMCSACRAEYEDPANRRFHAEPTCCPVCGPRVWLADRAGGEVPCGAPIGEAIRCLSAGAIVAIKGLGGFHLACDAANTEAVALLRARKHRDLKPFAIMVRDAAAAEAICRFACDAERRLLESAERPIVLLDKLPAHALAEGVAPRSPSFGVMLPYTPLHHLLMEGPFRALVMTSGNLSDEPIAHTNEDAFHRLAELADWFLLHNRRIHIRTDDSVVRVIAGQLRFLRRSRGYAPFPVKLPFDTTGNEILAAGPELNNTVCVTRGEYAFLSHHIGDLTNLAAYEAFLQGVEHLQNVLEVYPATIAFDPHPGYLSTKYAREQTAKGVPVQHHHAHAVSALVEANHPGPAIAVSFDGLGWGADDLLWGGEFLVVHDYARSDRVAHLESVPQPGGDAAAKETTRMAFAYLHAAFGADAVRLCQEWFPDQADRFPLLARMIARRVNCPHTTSMGRLFDAAAALLGICRYNTFHSQAPMELEAQAHLAASEQQAYDAGMVSSGDGALVVKSTDVIRALVNDIRRNVSAPVCAARFHNAIAHATLCVCEHIRKRSGLSTVALSGGVFANKFLTERLVSLLENKGFNALLNAAVPPGDGGVSLGQAAAAAWSCKKHVPGDSSANY